MGVGPASFRPSGDSIPPRLEDAKLVWLESPTNPGLDVCDIKASAATAHAAGALVAVDNTTATPLGQRPLALGADFVLSSDTKSVTGHGDLILGHVAVRETQWVEKLRTWRTQTGSVPGPFEVWLAHRSLSTLAVRLDRQCGNAQAIAEFLATRGEVVRVRYPGLPGDPSHEIAATADAPLRPGRVVRGGRAAEPRAVSRKLPSGGRGDEFRGGAHHGRAPSPWGADAVGEGFIRLSAGCEHIDDLLADIAQALDRYGRDPSGVAGCRAGAAVRDPRLAGPIRRRGRHHRPRGGAGRRLRSRALERLAGGRNDVRWRAFRRALHGFNAVVLGNQIHGVEVMTLDAGVGWIQVEGIDGWTTSAPGILLTVTIADCVPVYLVVPGRAVALLHAGWRGTAGGILHRGVSRLSGTTGASPSEMVMHCGVAICGECYEVGVEVMEGCGFAGRGPAPFI